MTKDLEATMDLVFEYDLPESKRRLIGRVHEEMGIDTSDLLVVFDNQDIGSFPPNPIYTERAFHLRLEGLEHAAPTHLEPLIEGRNWSHLIYIAMRSCILGDSEFVWRYSHELQHHRQSIKWPELPLISALVRKAYCKDSSKKHQIEIPTEFDSEWAAREIVLQMFGSNAVNSHQQKNREYWKRFEELARLWQAPIDPWLETRKIFCAKRRSFEKQRDSLRQNQSAIQISSRFLFDDIDFDQLCSDDALNRGA